MPAASLGRPERTGGCGTGVCPNCAAPRTPGEAFCEVCGCEFATGLLPAPPPPPRPVEPAAKPGHGSWHAVVGTDRAFFDSGRAEQGNDVVFPESVTPSDVRLEGDAVVIGRRRGCDDGFAGIDLSESSGDPCVSRRHALLVAQADGTWTITDTHSTNGTWVNAERTPPDQPRMLRDGDRIFIGAFTVIAMRYDPEVTP
ncbi:MAG: FHA domain-containing protein [Acidimicrobiales bacterium]